MRLENNPERRVFCIKSRDKRIKRRWLTFPEKSNQCLIVHTSKMLTNMQDEILGQYFNLTNFSDKKAVLKYIYIFSLSFSIHFSSFIRLSGWLPTILFTHWFLVNFLDGGETSQTFFIPSEAFRFVVTVQKGVPRFSFSSYLKIQTVY